MRLGEPVYVGAAASAPAGIRNLEIERFPKETRKQDVMDYFGRQVASMLPAAMRGHYASA